MPTRRTAGAAVRVGKIARGPGAHRAFSAGDFTHPTPGLCRVGKGATFGLSAEQTSLPTPIGLLEMQQKRTRNAFVGSPVERIEDFRFLRGRGQFVDDLARDDLLHAVILRSSVAHGRVRGIATGAARARPGVHAVITAADIGAVIPRIPLRQESSPAFEPYEQPVIAHGKVRYVGEPVAVVLAESAAAAEDALDAITLDIESLPAVVDSAAAGKNDILLFEAAPGNLALTLSGVRGDADAAFNGAAYVRRERFTVQRHGAVPMEPRGLLAEWDAAGGRL